MTSFDTEIYYDTKMDTADSWGSTEDGLKGSAENRSHQASESPANENGETESERAPFEDNIFWVYVEELKKGD
ncbi:MAG: hypothetical protein QNJ84_07890 [Alphaproteobacteria bacterium]|nr:hypothetical protein [Alphaproteobacteria bacterium]